jgi:uncharacterized Zn finger protein (UPF0148 family)
MSALRLHNGHRYALLQALKALELLRSPEEPALRELAVMVTASKECVVCGCSDIGFNFRFGSTTCPHCEADLTREANERHDAEAEANEVRR